MTEFSGGCLCGAIRYEVTGDPIRAAHCHCDDCRRATGASFATNVFFKEEDLTVTQGTPKRFQHKADSGNTSTRKFCPVCGAPVMAVSSGMPDLAMLVAGSLDDPSVFKPTMDVFTDCAQPWDHMDPELAKFPGMPEMPG